MGAGMKGQATTEYRSPGNSFDPPKSRAGPSAQTASFLIPKTRSRNRRRVMTLYQNSINENNECRKRTASEVQKIVRPTSRLTSTEDDF